ncbi:protein adenylyltransferase SelO [Comamonas granuli]|uniref:protein adenylyltransferase SelO n=1 Tax=Comamonas granuli TaxID=290309 RepID=UPI0005A7CB28|nr:YdiU family protein [Comamonas granuli]
MNAPAAARLPTVDTGLSWSNSFAALGPGFYTRLAPRPLPAPCHVASSPDVAQQLGLPAAWLQSEDALRLFSGNALPQGGEPLASVYSGHQFGVWAGQLGDGRALLLGEAQTAHGPQEIQLKGSGLTPYSRMGDGRAVLRSSIREFLCSEAMHALGVPTTRALYLCGSPEPVQREAVETAAVVTRVAPSFIRFGHFEHFAARSQFDALQQLADYVIARFYPECADGADCGGHAGNRYAALLQAVSERSAALVAQWQAVGFCHGVLNTDNMSILGLTIDYGPFQFLDHFDPGHICNHSDRQGRYAYEQQPGVVLWNLYRLGQALQPLIGDPAIAMGALESYRTLYPQHFMQRMRAKLGLGAAHAGDSAVIDGILHLLADQAVDYPIFWRRLSLAVADADFEPVRDLFADRARLDRWLLSFEEHAALSGRAPDADLMLKNNPAIVLRNHLAEQAIRAAQQGDFSELHTLQHLLQRPCEDHPGHEARTGFPPDWAAHLSISCSS